MTSTATRKLKLRLMLDGVEVPVMGADVMCSQGAPATANIRVIAHPSVMRLKPRTLVLLFFYDWLSGAGDQSDSGYKLLFSGDLLGVEYNKTNSSRDATLICEDHSSYYDIGYAYYTLAGGETVAQITEEKARFVGAQRGFFQATSTNDLTGIIQRIFEDEDPPRSEGFRGVEGMLGSIIRVIEVFTGVGDASAANQFFKFNTARLGLLGQLSLYEKDTTASTLLSAQFIVDFIKKRAEQLGELVTLRQIINMLLEFMYYSTCPNPCARYGAQGLSNPVDMGAIRTSAQELSAQILKFSAGGQGIHARDRKPSNIGLSSRLHTNAIDIETVELGESTGPLVELVIKARAIRETAPDVYMKCQLVLMMTALLFDNNESDYTEPEVTAILGELEALSSVEDRGLTRAQQLGTTLVLPDLFFAVAPRCNVLFPDMYGQLRYGSRVGKEPTRMHLTTNMDERLLDNGGAGDRIYYAPSIEQLRSAQRFSVATFEEGSEDGSLFARLFDHELFTGIIPAFSRVDRLAFMVAVAALKEDGDFGFTDDSDTDDFFIRIANYQYIKQKLATRSLSASGPFNPAAVVGLPMVVLDGTAIPGGDKIQSPESATADNEHYVGVLVSLSHSISQEGSASTSYQLQYARPHRGKDDEFLQGLVTADFDDLAGVLPLEEAIRPRFIDSGYSAPNIGRDVYSQVLGCESITDAAGRLGAPKVNIIIPPVGEQDAAVVTGVTQETAIDQIAYVYAGISVSKADYAEGWVRRPIATLNQTLDYFKLAYVASEKEAKEGKRIDSLGGLYVEGEGPPPPGYQPAGDAGVAAVDAAVHPSIDVRLARHKAVVEYARAVTNRALRG